MLIKIINFRRKDPRKARDLRRLIRYLLTPKASRTKLKTPPRLLGPPIFSHLVLSSEPWEPNIAAVATDVADQFVLYCRRACAGRKIPDAWYVHIIFSFAAAATADLIDPPDNHVSPRRHKSSASNAVRIAKDALDFMGAPNSQPAIFVVHGDRRHVHVHAVVALPFVGPEDWDLLRISRVQLNEIAKICAGAFQLPLTKRAARAHHRLSTAGLDVE